MTGGKVEQVRALLSDRVLVGEVLKFGVIGVGGVVVDFIVFNLALHRGIGPLSSNAISTTVAAVLSYFANRHWSFAHRARTGLSRELPLFIGLSAIGLAINEVPLAITHYALHLDSNLEDNLSKYTIGLVLATAWRFWSFKRWVFVKGTHDDEVLASAAI